MFLSFFNLTFFLFLPWSWPFELLFFCFRWIHPSPHHLCSEFSQCSPRLWTICWLVLLCLTMTDSHLPDSSFDGPRAIFPLILSLMEHCHLFSFSLGFYNEGLKVWKGRSPFGAIAQDGAFEGVKWASCFLANDTNFGAALMKPFMIYYLLAYKEVFPTKFDG